MRLTLDNATAVLEPLTELIEGAGQELHSAAQSWVDLDGETSADAREERADYRETWEDNTSEVEAQAIALVEAFGYVAVPRRDARKAKG